MKIYYFAMRILAEFGQIDFEICGAPKFDDRRLFLLQRLGKVQSLGKWSLSDPVPVTVRPSMTCDPRSSFTVFAVTGAVLATVAAGKAVSRANMSWRERNQW